MEVTIDSLFARVGRLTVENELLRGENADLRAEVESLRACATATAGELEALRAGQGDHVPAALPAKRRR